MSSELGLFVLWSGSRFAQGRILSDIEERFQVRRVYDVEWNPERITANYARFYQGRAQSPYRAAFEEQKGRGPFLLVTVVDERPCYAERATLKGVRTVNTRFFDAKMRYRDWVGGTMRVHATDTSREARRDLTLLLGRDADQYLAEHPGVWDGQARSVRRDLAGAQGWVSREQLIDVLGATTNYVALSGKRAGEPLILLTDDYEELVRIANARPLLGQLPRWGGDFATWVARGDIEFEIRFVGDGYLDEGFARSLLENRIRQPRDFYRPSDDDARDFQAYHALVHRGPGPKPTKPDVDALLERRGARYSLPRDPVVSVDFGPLPYILPSVCSVLWSLQRVRWRTWHRTVRPFSVAWWRIREPLRRQIGRLRRLRPAHRKEQPAPTPKATASAVDSG